MHVDFILTVTQPQNKATLNNRYITKSVDGGTKAAPTCHYTGYAGCAITTGIPVNFDTAHGRSGPEVGSAKCIEAYGSEGVSRPSRILGKPEQNIISPTHVLRPKQNFYSLTICTLDQYLPNGSEKSGLLS